MNSPFNKWFHSVVSALCWSSGAERADGRTDYLNGPYNDLTQFVLQQHADMAGYLREPLKVATLAFDAFAILQTGKLFHHLPPVARARQISAWKNSRIGFKRDLVRYFESLGMLQLYSRNDAEGPAYLSATDLDRLHSTQVIHEPASQHVYDAVVVGSGPGGAITAALLAEAGRNVLLLEEGPYLPLDSCNPFTKQEMVQKYRNGGQTVAMGANKVAYVEGRCVGGGSEINSGLYHRTPPDILDRWKREFAVADSSPTDLLPFFETCEKDVSVSYLPGAAPAASLKLHEGATALGWKSMEVPRWFSHKSPDGKPLPQGKRQSMTETFIPRLLKAGGFLLPKTRVGNLRQENGRWLIAAKHASGKPLQIEAKNLFICAGAIQTPAILRRSGIQQNIGNSLQLHPTVKVVARFPEAVNSAQMGVPVHQVKEFSPRYSFGCSISTTPYLALALLDQPSQARQVAHIWPHLATYYSMITGEGSGTVRALPRFRDPLVRYKITENDRRDLADGLRKISMALFESGATQLFPGVTGMASLSSRDDLSKLPNVMPSGMASLMTIHLFSSCPMGEDKSKCATDSFGQAHGFNNLFINDASLICTAPGVNPQGTVMALSRRNTLKFLDRK